MLENEYKFFEQHRNELIKNHNNEFVLIYNQEVQGFFKTIEDAIDYASRQKFKLGAFLVEQCILKNDSIHKFHSRVIFQ